MIRASSPGSGVEKSTPTTVKTAYRDFVLRNGAWEGVDKLTPEEAQHLGRSFAFTSIGDPKHTVEVRVENGSGQCPAKGFESVTGDTIGGEEVCSYARACRTVMLYRDNGTVDRQTYYDQFGDIVERLEYASPNVGQFLDARLPCTHGRAGIRLLEIEPIVFGRAKGFDKAVRFLGGDIGNEKPRPNDAGNYGRKKEYDDGGHVTAITNMGPRDQNWAAGSAVATERFTYNALVD